MISKSPLRYPGGKARFTNFIWEAIASSGEKANLLIEPFCGGAGASLALLESGRVQRISLNDIDPLVASFWKIVFGKNRHTRHDINWLIGQVENANLSIPEWRRQKALKPNSAREAAWKCLYLNRTSFNGILHKAGPIGGWEQKNRNLDVRFNRAKLIRRLGELYEMRDQIDRVDCVDWRLFCSTYRMSKTSYIYLDPPYYHRAEQLYGHLFDDAAHSRMRDYLVNLPTPWMLSYDDATEVRSLYNGLSGIDGRVLDQTYSAHPVGGASFVGRELFFSNRALPHKARNRDVAAHVGLSVVGAIDAVAPPQAGPTRTPFERAEVIVM